MRECEVLSWILEDVNGDWFLGVVKLASLMPNHLGDAGLNPDLTKDSQH